MAEFPALPLWTDAYLGDTNHLTTIEHGAYLLLLMTAWRSKDGMLPNDDKLLSRYAKLTLGQWKRIKPILEPFFTISSDGWRQGRLTDELVAVKQKSKRQTDKAKTRWLKNNNSGNAVASSGQSQKDAGQSPSDASLTLTPTLLKDKESFRESSAPPDFESLVFEKEFLKVATEAGLTPEVGAKSFGVWKIKRRTAPPKDLLGDFWIWCLKERPPADATSQPPGKALEGRDLLIHQVGVANWKRGLGKKLDPADERELLEYEKRHGAVTWNNLSDWEKKFKKVG